MRLSLKIVRILATYAVFFRLLFKAIGCFIVRPLTGLGTHQISCCIWEEFRSPILGDFRLLVVEGGSTRGLFTIAYYCSLDLAGLKLSVMFVFLWFGERFSSWSYSDVWLLNSPI